MTREEKLFTMTGPTLIEVAAKVGLVITKNKLKQGKAKVIAEILKAEAAAAETEISAVTETPIEVEAPTAIEATGVYRVIDSEAPTEPVEELSASGKQNDKAKTKRSNLKLTELTYQGQTKTIRQWAEEIGMPWPTLYDRVNRNGWTVEDAIEIPLGKRRAK